MYIILVLSVLYHYSTLSSENHEARRMSLVSEVNAETKRAKDKITDQELQ